MTSGFQVICVAKKGFPSLLYCFVLVVWVLGIWVINYFAVTFQHVVITLPPLPNLASSSREPFALTYSDPWHIFG